MLDLIRNTISWEKLYTHNKEECRISITKATVNKSGDTLKLAIKLNFIIPESDIDDIKKAISCKVEGLTRIDFVFEYEDLILPPEEIIRLYLPHMIREVNGKYTAITNTIIPEEFFYEPSTGGAPGTTTIYVLGDTAAEKLNEHLASKFSGLLNEKFGMRTSVCFENHKERYDETLEARRVQVFQELKATEEKQREASKKIKPVSPKANFASEKGILGKPIKEEIVSISSLNVEMGKAAVKGILFKKDVRSIKSDKRMVSLLITDKTTSLCCKLFCSDEKWKELDEKLENGSSIKVLGQPEWDTFDNTLVLKTLAIEIGATTLREDTAPVKRVELHCHTKMSENDGLNDVSNLLKTVAAWGQDAIAITDHGVVHAFPEAFHALHDKGHPVDLKVIYGMEGYLYDDTGREGSFEVKGNAYHIILLAKNQKGLRNLYELVSESHLNYVYKKRPRIPKSLLASKREGIIIGSACEAGEFFTALINGKSDKEVKQIADFYDYLEIMPLVNNQFLIDKGKLADKEQLKELNRITVRIGKEIGKPVVATTDSHYTDPEDAIYRKIIQTGQGYKDAEGGKGLYLRTTQEMLDEFSYLGEEIAYEVVVSNTRLIADTVEVLRPVPVGKYPPKIKDADKILRDACMQKAHSIYGDPLPEEIDARLEKELKSIIGNGYAVMYVSAKMLVEKSLDDGYLVGSRGSVGSSFAATMAGITEVNPLPPHYVCPECKHFEWGDNKSYDCGVDMPIKTCEACGTIMDQLGFSIPFETFLGFEGDKEPDIDLNFAGEYQGTAHKYVEEIFGKGNVFKAGTIGTIKSRTAYGYVKKYFEETGTSTNKWEIERLTEGCTEIRRTTGQHPGGIIIVPEGHDIHEFCPVQHPANDMNTEIITTHFDYHSIDQNLLKLDILGHDVPSQIRHLQDMTGLDPLKVPLHDDKVNSLFTSTEALDIKNPEYKFLHGTYGIPEFGTEFVRRMLDDTKPTRFADLVRISGFSHGTDVWNNNASEFIKNGMATMNDAISTRDDIMNYLILKGLPNKDAFKIMEGVRKGKGVSDEYVALMERNGIPGWYIESCRRIKYMFPRAHAVAYVMMSYRIAYYKVYYPAEFYAAYFTVKRDDFNSDLIHTGVRGAMERIQELNSKGKAATDKEKNEVTVLEVMYEMFSRGLEFLPARLGISDAMKFNAEAGKVRIPLAAMSGVGEAAARMICCEFDLKPFETVDELRERSKANQTAVEAMKNHGVLEGLPESDQLSLF